MKFNFLLKSILLSAVLLGVVSCKEQVAEIGQTAPDIAAFDLQGNKVELKQWQGKPILLSFWSESCGVCLAELKEFEKLSAQYPDQLQVVAINTDGNKGNTQATVQKRQIQLTVIKDQMQITGERYQIVGTPTTFFIDSEGKIRYKFEGLIPKNKLEQLFTQS
ncbi:TlpA family protein disulfide reductase [Pasteurellaceae bacterium 22721_9_1]